jgi:hypothetical protein
MRRLFVSAVAGAAIALASPAHAGGPPPTPTPSNDPCSYAVVTGAVACVGYYSGNLLTGGAGSATTSTEQSYINMLLGGSPTNSGAGYTPPYTIDTSKVLAAIGSVSGNTDGVPFTFDFSPLQLSGWTVFGAHFGNFPDSSIDGKQAPNVTAFWLVNLGSYPTSGITIYNGQGLSNAQIFGTGTPAVPEPATWGLMLLGFAGVGLALRRSRNRKPALMQIA